MSALPPKADMVQHDRDVRFCARLGHSASHDCVSDPLATELASLAEYNRASSVKCSLRTMLRQQERAPAGRLIPTGAPSKRPNTKTRGSPARSDPSRSSQPFPAIQRRRSDSLLTSSFLIHGGNANSRHTELRYCIRADRRAQACARTSRGADGRGTLPSCR